MLSKLKIILLLITFIFIWSCGDKEKKISEIVEIDIEMQMTNSFRQGYLELEKGDVLLAAKKFNEAELLYPQSEWAAKSALMAAYTYYKSDYYYDAIYELKRFIKTYPLEPKIDYAHYLLAICYYEIIVDEKKDIAPIINSKKEFEYVVKNYPNTDYAKDSVFKLNLIHDILASKEMYLARYYMNKKKWIPAINRFKTIIRDYDTTVYAAEALHRLVEIHYKIGLLEESQKYASTLGYNYLSNEWYKKTYKIFNKKYENPLIIIKKDKKFTVKKMFKQLLD